LDLGRGGGDGVGVGSGAGTIIASHPDEVGGVADQTQSPVAGDVAYVQGVVSGHQGGEGGVGGDVQLIAGGGWIGGPGQVESSADDAGGGVEDYRIDRAGDQSFDGNLAPEIYPDFFS